MRSLLDVNVLIALLDEDHVHHASARAWFRSEGVHGWASCPITQNGCVRIMTQPAYPSPVPVVDVVERLREATGHVAHEFWPDDVSLLDPIRLDITRLHGPKQITDAYLLALAVAHGGRLATFDDRAPLSAVIGATRANLTVI